MRWYIWTDPHGNTYYQRIDHILISKNLKRRLVSAAIDHTVPAEVSDHHPAMVVLKF